MFDVSFCASCTVGCARSNAEASFAHSRAGVASDATGNRVKRLGRR